MTDDVRDLRDEVYRYYDKQYPELLRAAVTEKQVCLDIVRCMDNPDSFGLALFVLAYDWPADAGMIERCQEVIGDRMVHEKYRSHAITYLQFVHRWTKDPTTIAALISVISDEGNSEDLRVTAYYAFLSVIHYYRGLCRRLWSPIPNSTRDIKWWLIRRWSRDC